VSHEKSLALHLKAAPAADDAALAAINAFTLRPFAADELQLREYVLAHNCIDRDNEVFDESLLDDFATSLPGKGIFVNHPTSWRSDGGPAEGKVYACRTETMTLDAARTLLREPDLTLPPDRTQVKLLYASAYFAKTDENAALLIKQDAGIAGDVSIGFETELREPVPIKDAQGRELTARRWQSPGKALEMSLVWLGAQPGAHAVKSAQQKPEPEQTMSLTNEEIAALQTKAASGEKSANVLAALKTALGDDATLLDNVVELKAYIADAKAAKALLVDDIIAMERQLKIVGDESEAVTAAKEFHAGNSVERLRAIQKGYEDRLPQQRTVKGANANQGAPGSQETAKDSVINNPALAG
jgi:enamine deaminase RidA (YjgF/YER057c/UK114 family)